MKCEETITISRKEWIALNEELKYLRKKIIKSERKAEISEMMTTRWQKFAAKKDEAMRDLEDAIKIWKKRNKVI